MAGIGIGTAGFEEPTFATVVLPFNDTVRESPPNEAFRANAGAFGGKLVSGCRSDFPDCLVLFIMTGELCTEIVSIPCRKYCHKIKLTSGLKHSEQTFTAPNGSTVLM